MKYSNENPIAASDQTYDDDAPSQVFKLQLLFCQHTPVAIQNSIVEYLNLYAPDVSCSTLIFTQALLEEPDHNTASLYISTKSAEQDPVDLSNFDNFPAPITVLHDASDNEYYQKLVTKCVECLKVQMQLKVTEQALLETHQCFDDTRDSSTDPIILHNGFEIVQANRAAAEMLKFNIEELERMDLRQLLPEPNHNELETCLNKKNYELECKLQTKKGFSVTAVLRGKKTKYRQREVTVTSIHDVGLYKYFLSEINKASNYDHLTNLPNRKLFLQRIQDCLLDNSEGKLFVMMIDLDDFKVVNESLGYPVGDQLLVEVSRVLTEQMQDGHHMIARVGGDEFGVLVDGKIDIEYVEKLAVNIIDALKKPLHFYGHEVTVTPSIGISVAPEDGDNAEELLRNADSAMFQTKNRGKHGFVFFNTEMNKRALQLLDLEAELRHGLENKEFEPFYQPKINLRTGKIEGMEVLARWLNPKRGLVSPIEFINLAEKIGLIEEVGHQILEKACEASRPWFASGNLKGRMSFNLSPSQFRGARLVSGLNDILERTQFCHDWLEVEVTEGAVMGDTQKALQLMNQIKELGVHISIDDFGTGYSSLSYLKRFPLDTLKIDRAFIMDMETSKIDYSIVSSVITLAHNLELTVVAEGVENISQVALLKALNCEFLQGFIYSPPVDGQKFAALLASPKELFPE